MLMEEVENGTPAEVSGPYDHDELPELVKST